MFDCANVEMRELLPELVAGTLDAATRARVEQHVATCAECASELETLRLVRSAYGKTPPIDVRRVVAALPKPAAAPRIAGGRAPIRRWVDWRVAAALTTITVGALSVAVSQRLADDVPPPATVVVAPPSASASIPASSPTTPSVRPRTDTAKPTRPAPKPVSANATKAQLSFGGGVDDLDDASIKELLGALEAIDRAPVAPSAEPDRTPVLPVIKSEDR